MCRTGLVAVGTALGALAVCAGCAGDRITEPQVLGGVRVPAERLERGRVLYAQLCTGCHGQAGRADHDAARSMRPRPRDLTLGVYKFASVPAGALPTDDDLRRTIRDGLAGTAMTAHDGLSDADLQALVDVVKWLSPRWRTELPGAPVALPDDPWAGADRAAAIARGEVVYHEVAQCWSCHPAYVQMGEHRSRPKVEPGASGLPKAVTFQADPHRPVEVETSLGVALPPDFLGDTFRAGYAEADLLRTVASGIGGSSMPGWQGRLSDSDLWAVVHYVRDLVSKIGTPEATRLRAELGVDDPSERSPHTPAP
jgi:mono/diheme cytochrome c family protein